MTNWATGWVSGDIVDRFEFPKGVGLLADETKGAAGASFDFSSLENDYAHLRCYLFVRGDALSATTSVHLRFNNDSGSNYDGILGRLSAGAGAWISAETIAGTNVQMGNIPAASATADSYAGYVVDVFQYVNAADHKVVWAQGANKFGTSTTNFEVRVCSGFWRSTAAINRIQFLLGSGNFEVGSRCSVYGFGFGT